MNTFRVVVGSDEAGYEYKQRIKTDLQSDSRVIEVTDVGVDANGLTNYPTVAIRAAEMIARGAADRAILICGTGLGVAIAANKVKGVRAATAHDSYSVERSILSNNAQILCMGQRVIGIELARKLVREWLSHTFDEASPSNAKVGEINSYEAH
ncbi:ribose-5-phosphate isomerase [Nonomuraea sp. NPDC026600]|uniref:ribose-5-phosphate isomerase n=1 Tax=Nonomuraea sp. NPDC026600 TaxID=3155363 RepID=UPI0033C78DA4